MLTLVNKTELDMFRNPIVINSSSHSGMLLKLLYLGFIMIATTIFLTCYTYKQEEYNSHFGTLETITTSVEYDGEIFFLYPTGPIRIPVGISKYNLLKKETDVAIALSEDIMGLQIYNNQIIYATSNAIYISDLSGNHCTTIFQSDESYRSDESYQYNISWFFVWKEEVIFYISNFGSELREGDELTGEIMSINIENLEERIILQENNLFFWPESSICYWDGKLYSKGMKSTKIHSVDLYDGAISLEYQGPFVERIYSDKRGVVYQTTDDETNLRVQNRLGQSETMSAQDGELIGCNGEDCFYVEKDGSDGSIAKVFQESSQLLISKFEWDMLSYPNAFAVGDYVMFYSTDMLIEGMVSEAEPVHYLYLLDGEQLSVIYSYQPVR